jgi:DMSO/TMAO reductase YedYZ molybdopterin-dependent catalytic subunit
MLAALAAGVVMLLLRSTAEVRTISERVLEWLLLFIPPNLFEATLQRFGFDAKRYALAATSVGLLGVLAGLGALALGRRWSGRTLLALGAGLWLFVMLVIMPVTSAGLFATDLAGGTWVAIFGYLAVAFAYAGVLALARLLFDLGGGQSSARRRHTSRRAALVGLGTALAALVSTYVVELVGPRQRLTPVRVLDPQEPVASGGLDEPQSHPNGVDAGPPTATEATEVSDVAEPTRVPRPEGAANPQFPEPGPPRPLKRGKDGVVLASGRRQGELTSLITDNDDFYVVTKNAAGDPVLRAGEWRLRVDGEVERAIELDYASLRSLPAVDITKTLECISNLAAKCELAPYGCDLISTARWRGARVADLLQLANPRPDVTYLVIISADEYTAALPIEVAMDPEALLVYEMNGAVLPREHGYPARLLVPGRYGMKNPKWVVGLQPMRREFIDWYGQRNWSREGRIKTMSRIDVPTPGADLAAGEYNIAGIAYAGDRGISRVEYSSDGGESWQVATFVEPPAARDSWVRWIGRFTPQPGVQTALVARATDGSDAVQAEDFSLPQPDGSAGWPRVEVRAQPA